MSNESSHEEIGSPEAGSAEFSNSSGSAESSGSTGSAESTGSSRPGVSAENAAPENTRPQVLSGNEAVNRAAEQAKTTGSRNIPGLGDLPVPDDTANLREGPNLHDGLLALLPLVGVWRGEGQARDFDGTEYAFGQQIIFSHDGENYLSYESRTWKLDHEGEFVAADQRESGFWRISPKDEIEFVCAHASGVVEIFYGEPISERAWQVESASTMVTASGPTTLGPGKRLYGLMPTNELGWVDERMVNGELVPRMSAQLKRHMG